MAAVSQTKKARASRASVAQTKTASVLPLTAEDSLAKASAGIPLLAGLDGRAHRKLEFYRLLDRQIKRSREKPYVPSSKANLFLENSPIAMRQFISKASQLHLPLDLTGQTSSSEAGKATPLGYPTFTPEFVSCFYG
ncbi:unnamed protein product [Protopolystoma xenopodis]|uniref:Uncharacterized protein n=1 Tax=Protopolystoma xenopodis TaxID=117903 RepID=A0A448XM56_9PLAT|nr:unnamed protein product [Protopolystoma xenopodis]